MSASDPSTWPTTEDGRHRRRGNTTVLASRHPVRRGVGSTSRKDGKPRKRNRYPAPCAWCWETIPAEEGVIEGNRDKGFATLHPYGCPSAPPRSRT